LKSLSIYVILIPAWHSFTLNFSKIERKSVSYNSFFKIKIEIYTSFFFFQKNHSDCTYPSFWIPVEDWGLDKCPDLSFWRLVSGTSTNARMCHYGDFCLGPRQMPGYVILETCVEPRQMPGSGDLCLGPRQMPGCVILETCVLDLDKCPDLSLWRPLSGTCNTVYMAV
jgi:hypothetical protein